MEDGIRYRPGTPLSDSEIEDTPEPMEMVDEEDFVRKSMATHCKWCPLLTSVCVLVYLHGIALGWYMCSK